MHSSTGSLYAAGSAGSEEVSLRLVSRAHLAVVSAAGERLYSHESLKIADRLASLPREITLPDGSLLVAPSSAEVNAWLDRQPVRNWLFAQEGRLGFILASAVLAPLLLFLLFRYALPAFAIHFAEWVPDAYVEIASEQTLAALDRTALDPTALPEAQRAGYLAHWQGTLDSLGLDPGDYRIGFRSSKTMGPNAFALPNGRIIFTDQLVQLLEGDSDILQAILLHEIGHVEERHSMRMVAQSLAATVLISYLFGDLSGLAELFLGGAATIIDNKFSQALEWEADEYALQRLAAIPGGKADFAAAMQNLADTVGEDSAVDAWLSSHPSMRERIRNARRPR